MRWMKAVTDADHCIGADDHFISRGKYASVRDSQGTKTTYHVDGGADHGHAAMEVTKGDGRCCCNSRISGQCFEQVTRDQWERGRLQEYGGQHKLCLAARCADDQVERIGRGSATFAQGPLLRTDGNAERDGKADQHDDRDGVAQPALEVCRDDRPGIHHAIRP